MKLSKKTYLIAENSHFGAEFLASNTEIYFYMDELINIIEW